MNRSVIFSAILAGVVGVGGCGKRPQPKEPERAGPGKAKRGRAAEPASPGALSRIERLLPEGTIAYISIDDISRAKNDLAKTALGAILREEEVRTFLGKPLGRLATLMGQLEKKYGFSFDDARKAFGGQLAGALV